MRTEQEVLDNINTLRSQLGMEPKSEQKAPTAESAQDVHSRINALNQKLASTPMSRREFLEKRASDEQMSFERKAYQFGAGMGEGFSMLFGQGKDAVVEFYQGMTEKDFDGDSARVFAQTLGAIGEVGAKDFWQFGKTIIGSIGDELGGYTEEQEADREYQRYIENFNYNTVAREEMLKDVEYRKIADFGANFIDPFMLFPVAKLGSIGVRGVTKSVQKGATNLAYSSRSAGAVNLAKFAQGTAKVAGKVDKVVDVVGKIGAYPTEMASRLTASVLRKGIKGSSAVAGLGLKGVGKVGAGVEFVASAPRKIAEKMISKVKPEGGGFLAGGQVVGALTGVPGALELGIAEGLGAIAKKVGSKAGAVLSELGKPSANKRFLHRLATSDKVSEATRKRAMWAYTHYGTSVGDAMFNAMANSLTLGGINAGLAGIAGEDARATGAAFGSGAMAGMLPVGLDGKTAGKSDVARDSRSIDQYMKQKLAMDQRTEFSKLPRHTQVLIATLQESGIGAPEVKMVESKPYLDMLNAERAKVNEQRIQNNQKPLLFLDRAPSGHYEPSSGTIYMNADKLKDSSLVGIESMTHEIGHDYMHKALGKDPAMLELILERYKTTKDDPNGTAFYMMTDGEGNGIGEPIYLNQEATQFRTDYDRVQKGIAIGNDANLLAQEIGAEQFAMHFVEEPNVLKQIHPRIRRYALDASRKLLSKIGVVDASTGNPLFNPISKEMRKNPAIERIYKNYGAMRAFELDEKANLAKDGILIEPKQGQTGESRYTQLFGGIGLKLKDAKNLVVTNKGLLRELINLRDRWKDDPSDGWSVKRGQLEGKNLTGDVRTIFTRNDPFGNVANILDALQQAIDERIGIRFGYRSGTKGKYQNPFRLRDVAIFGWQVGPMGGKGRATLKVLGYDQAVVRQNVQVLVEKGYIKDPNQFMTELAEQGQKALQDPEGRINPEGRAENEIMTVAFGLKESADQVRSEGLRDLLESKAVNKSFRSYDVEALAGLTKGESKAFAFDYYNVRNNYNPFRGSSDKLFMPDTGKTSDSIVNTLEDAKAGGFGEYKQAPWLEDSLKESADKQYQISTRNPTATNRTQDPVATNLIITLDDILEAPGMAESYASAVNRYPGVKPSKAKPEKVISKFVDMVEDNLLHLYDSVEPEIRERSKLWYVGARKLAIQFAQEYGFSTQAVAATMAATSPQTDWYKNVDRTRRILETVRDEQDTIFNEDMASKSVAVANKKDKATATALAKTMANKPFKELTIPQQAIFIRSFDELYRDRVYQIISPEGEFVGPALKDNGEIDKYSWLSYNQITKALSALADDSKANISGVMGGAHKIRNFYNNILLPYVDKMAVTIDTHAVAAGLLRPLASKDLEVANMLGAKPKGKAHASIKNSSVAGISGLYGIYAEAYRRAANARGVLPREMQSITWEAIRGLYPKEIKQPKFKEQINNLFKDYENSKITIDELRTKVFQKAGGIDPPTWYKGSDSTRADRPTGSRDSQTSGASPDQGQLFRPSVRGLGASNRPRRVRATPSGASASGVNSFMMPATARAVATSASTLDRFRN
jgi:hypothetical protein